jgi:hypothetical protein
VSLCVFRAPSSVWTVIFLEDNKNEGGIPSLKNTQLQQIQVQIFLVVKRASPFGNEGEYIEKRI